MPLKRADAYGCFGGCHLGSRNEFGHGFVILRQQHLITSLNLLDQVCELAFFDFRSHRHGINITILTLKSSQFGFHSPTPADV